MSEITVNSLLVHNKSKFVLPLSATSQVSISDIDNLISKIVKFALTYNVVFDNISELTQIDSDTLDRVLAELSTILEQSKKDGWIFRGDFSTKENLEHYTDSDYLAIFAQYSITYGWSSVFSEVFSADPQSVMNLYFANSAARIGVVRDLLQSDTYVKSARKIALYPNSYMAELILDILTSPVPLNTYQKSLLAATNKQYLANLVAKADVEIPVGETKAIILNMILPECDTQTASEVLSKYIRRPSEVVQYFAISFLKDGEQINTEILKRVRMNVNKTLRKRFMTIIDSIGFKKGKEYLCEDMFRHYNFWKRLDKHLRWHKDSIMRHRYPTYMEAMDLLYLNDRSWTFNGRYSRAILSGDFLNAAEVAIENPGFFMRNIINLMRMSETGVLMPVKEGKKTPAQVREAEDLSMRNNIDLSSILAGTAGENLPKVITNGAADFFLKDRRFAELVKDMSLKNLIQLTGIMRDKELLVNPVYKRVTNGVPVSYSVPIPGVPEAVWLQVLDVVFETFKSKLKAVYDGTGAIFVDDTADQYAYSNSGRKSVDTSFSGELLTPGSYINIDNLNVGGDKILRLGVIWRGEKSVDIDHSVLFSFDGGKRNETCYYGYPELVVDNKLLAVSSGDITSCQRNTFSCEFIDIDLDLCKAAGVDSIMSTIQNYSRGPISDVECYTFVKVIDRTDRVSRSSTKVTIDLADTDYACSVSQNATGVSGFYILLKTTEDSILTEGSIYAINDKLVDHTAQDVSRMGNYSNSNERIKVERFLNSRVSVYDVLKHREITSPSTPGCQFVVSAHAELYTDFDVTVLHPAKDYDKIMSRVFNS